MSRHHHNTMTMARMRPLLGQFAEWLKQGIKEGSEPVGAVAGIVADLAYQAGADEQLRLCVEWLRSHERLNHIASGLCDSLAEDLESAMRPKPPSLKQQAINSLDKLTADLAFHGEDHSICSDIIRRALDSLPD